MTNHPNPLLSRTGILFTVVLLGALGFFVWKDRGLAFSPGPVTAMQQEGVIIQGFKSHADFEEQCRFCHLPLEATLGEMCLDCHTKIASQMENGDAIHGLIENAFKCQVCHSDHQGRDFNPTMAALEFFDHSGTQFNLSHHQFDYDGSPLACNACHSQSEYSALVDPACQVCHRSHDQEFIRTHNKEYGENCLGCHDGVDRMRVFDHNVTGFTLDGSHTQIVCRTCHSESQIRQVPTICQGCHAEPQLHQGLFELACENCHSTQSWSPASLNGQLFNHMTNTGFALDKHMVDYRGQAMLCNSCHQFNLETFTQQTCVDCHVSADQVFMQQHLSQFGVGCLSCHDGVDRMQEFDHESVFSLQGRHAEIGCSDCHLNQIFVGTPILCAQCHAEPEIHAGVFGLACESCHTTSAWSPAILLEHTFPLGHGLETGAMPTTCITCHPVGYTEYTCYGCHEHQEDDITREHLEEGISMADLPACVECHLNGHEVDRDD